MSGANVQSHGVQGCCAANGAEIKRNLGSHAKACSPRAKHGVCFKKIEKYLGGIYPIPLFSLLRRATMADGL
jgi:hypothetical protein